jgi:hypothetical protein
VSTPQPKPAAKFQKKAGLTISLGDDEDSDEKDDNK